MFRPAQGVDDEYVAMIPEMGLEFLFDSSQRVRALFMRETDHSGYNPFDGPDPRSVQFQSASEAIVWANERGIDAVYQESSTHPILGKIPEWVKFKFETFYAHYQFTSGGVEMVTLSLNNA